MAVRYERVDTTKDQVLEGIQSLGDNCGFSGCSEDYREMESILIEAMAQASFVLAQVREKIIELEAREEEEVQ